MNDRMSEHLACIISSNAVQGCLYESYENSSQNIFLIYRTSEILLFLLACQ